MTTANQPKESIKDFIEASTDLFDEQFIEEIAENYTPEEIAAELFAVLQSERFLRKLHIENCDKIKLQK